MRRLSALFLWIAIACVGVAMPRIAEAACTCTVTGPGQFPIVSDPSGCAGGGGIPLFKAEFKLLDGYTFGAMTPPTDWTVALSDGNTKATFQTTVQSARINPNQCLTFTLNVNNYTGDITLVLKEVKASYRRSATETCELELETNFAKLLANIVAVPSSVANGGTITVYMTVQNNGSATATVTPTTSSLSLSDPSLASCSASPSPTSLSIASGASGVFEWTCTAAAAPAFGSVTFSNSVRDSRNCLYSQWATSNAVLIGSLTASLNVAPDRIQSGGTVTVTMTVTNNSGTTLTNVTPSALTPGGTATKTLASGPVPATISSLAPGASTSFQWTYTVTGAAGQTYSFQGSATANSFTSNTATSNTGQVALCSATPGPVVNNGNGTYTVTWTLCNYSGSTVNGIEIKIPWPWLISSVTTTLGTVRAPQNPTSTGNGEVKIDPASLSSGTCGTVSVTFSSIPDGGSYSFPVELDGGGCGPAPINTVVSAPFRESSLVVSATPNPIPSGSSTSTVTALLCASSALSGSVAFSMTGAGTLSPPSQPISTSACSPCMGCPGGTTQSGTAQVTFTAPCPASGGSTSVAGQFLTATGSVVIAYPTSASCGGILRILDWREIVR